MILTTALILCACASTEMKSFQVRSAKPGADVDVNGVYMGITPVAVNLSCAKRWVGYMNSSDGYAYDGTTYAIDVYPTDVSPGTSQRKVINACQWHGQGQPEIMFDLSLKRTAPEQNIVFEQKH